MRVEQLRRGVCESVGYYVRRGEGCACFVIPPFTRESEKNICLRRTRIVFRQLSSVVQQASSMCLFFCSRRCQTQRGVLSWWMAWTSAPSRFVPRRLVVVRAISLAPCSRLRGGHSAARCMGVVESAPSACLLRGVGLVSTITEVQSNEDRR